MWLRALLSGSLARERSLTVVDDQPHRDVVAANIALADRLLPALEEGH